VDVDRVLAPDLVLHLPDGLEERQALDVSDRPAHLHDDEVVPVGGIEDEALDLVGDVGNHLHRLAQVLAVPLLVDDVLVDAAGGRVVVARHLRRAEALVVPEVEIGLAAVVGDVDLAVLEGAHRPRIDIYVRVELEVGDLQAAVLEEGPERGATEALPQGGHHAARDEDELRPLAALRGFVPAGTQGAHAVLLFSRKNSVRARSRSSGVSTASECQGPTATSMRSPK